MTISNNCGGSSLNNSLFTPGTATNNVAIPSNNAPRQQVVSSIDRAVRSLEGCPTGYKATITPGGGYNDRPETNTPSHPNGWAADTQLSCGGKTILPGQDPDLYNRYMTNLFGAAKGRGITAGGGAYDWGVHYDELPSRTVPGVDAVFWGPTGSRTSAAPWLVDAANNATPIPPEAPTLAPPAVGEAAAAVNEAAKTAAINCASPLGAGGAGGSGGGCSPVGVGVIGVAASLLGGAGLSIPGPLQAAASALSGGTSGLISAATSGALDAVVGAVPGLSTITDAVSNATKVIGSATSISGLMGNLPSNVTSALGILNNPVGGALNALAGNIPNLGNVVNSVAGNLLGNVSQFTSAFNMVQGAVGSAIGLGRGLDQLTGRLFGSAGSILAAQGTNLLGGFANMGIDTLAGSFTKSLIGPLNEVLPNLVSDTPMAAFGSMHKNFNSMITQGFGSITGNLNALGQDMAELGNLADMTDLLRIGKPGQLVSQLILSGAGYDTGVIQSLAAIGLSARDVNTFESDDIAYDVLTSITEPAQIDAAMIALGIRNRDGVENLGQLTDPAVLFPRSYSSNEFLELNEIAPQLMMCGTGGITSLGQLGQLFASMETMHGADAINNLPQPVSLDEINMMRSTLSPAGVYDPNGELTVADFLGTAAGYGHVNTLPKILELQEQVWADPITQNLKDMLQLLQDTLAGAYTDDIILMVIDVPATGSYPGGLYATLDDAVTDIQAAIEAEMESIKENASDETSEALFTLQSLHNESVNQLYREHYLRQQYGVKFGNTGRAVEFFRGDGSTTTFTLVGSVTTGGNIDVYVASAWQSKAAFSHNKTTNVITLDTAPTAGQTIEVIYDDGSIPLSSNPNEVWNFATNLETWAKNTGFGKESDFINRIATDDMHGQRIKAVMIQSRNKERAEAYGIACTGENRILSDFSEQHPNGLQSFVERTGVWSDDPGRASEVWLQIQNPDLEGGRINIRDAYYQRRLATAADMMEDNKNRALRDILDGLLFVADGQMILTDLGVLAYDTVDPDRGIYNLDLLNMSPKRDGFVLGSAVELITAMLDIEKLKDLQDQFLTNPSANTMAYLKKIEIDLVRLVSVLQMTMMSETANVFGLNLSDTRMVFGVPSVSKILLLNLSRVD